ncbi:hypothetical protein L21SP5_00560 [Salinivirga cyanobacteriivorans]|uniref:Uncharacterized protein n=1 Tax=Salinivirga cyanobacteriivorans TaxID=1307839 RepID=A0A0S2HWF4_9BACT|nr:hypothetical protein L21SP5_00560 [Salinivirga cyanobacteriivorans]
MFKWLNMEVSLYIYFFCRSFNITKAAYSKSNLYKYKFKSSNTTLNVINPQNKKGKLK